MAVKSSTGKKRLNVNPERITISEVSWSFSRIYSHQWGRDASYHYSLRVAAVKVRLKVHRGGTRLPDGERVSLRGAVVEATPTTP